MATTAGTGAALHRMAIQKPPPAHPVGFNVLLPVKTWIKFFKLLKITKIKFREQFCEFFLQNKNF